MLLSQSVRRGVLCGGGGVGEAAQGGHCMMEGWGEGVRGIYRWVVGRWVWGAGRGVFRDSDPDPDVRFEIRDRSVRWAHSLTHSLGETDLADE